MEKKNEGIEKLEDLVKWTNRKRTVKSVLRGCTSFFFITIIVFCLVFSLEHGINGLISFLSTLFLQFTLGEELSLLLTIIGYLILLFLFGTIMLTGILQYTKKKVADIEEDKIVI